MDPPSAPGRSAEEEQTRSAVGRRWPSGAVPLAATPSGAALTSGAALNVRDLALAAQAIKPSQFSERVATRAPRRLAQFGLELPAKPGSVLIRLAVQADTFPCKRFIHLRALEQQPVQ